MAADFRGTGGRLYGLRTLPPDRLAGGPGAGAVAGIPGIGDGRRVQHLFQLDLPDRRHGGGAGVVSLPGDLGRAPWRVLQPDPVRAVWHVLPGHRYGPDHAVNRPRTDGPVLLRP